MSKKTLNTANLERLGAARLAALVIDLVQGSAALQRRARLELSAAQGPGDVAADIRKRFASLRRSSSHVDWRGQRALVKDLNGLLDMIDGTVAPADPQEAFELLWAFLHLAPSIHARADDSNGAIGAVMAQAIARIAGIAPRLTLDAQALAERILEAVAADGYGAFDGIIRAMAEALGQRGLEHLGRITDAFADQPPTAQEMAALRGTGLAMSPAEIARRRRDITRSMILGDIADVQGDVDAYMARYSAEQLTFGTIAPEVAHRLLKAGRVEEAFGIVTRARAAEAGQSFRMLRSDLDAVEIECLERLGRTDALKALLWDRFAQTLCAASLRKYLRLLPDFEDMEAEESALAAVEAHPRLGMAIGFLVEWPAQDRAARTVLRRAAELDGNAYGTLTAAAAAVEGTHPLAATVMRRAMILDTLEGGKSSRYRHAARHLAECRACDGAIGSSGEGFLMRVAAEGRALARPRPALENLPRRKPRGAG